MNTNTAQRPWKSMPELRKLAHENGWTLKAERGGVARFERRDPRSETGAVLLHVEFNRGGNIASAWIDARRTVGTRDANKLETIRRWMTESVPLEHHDAGLCANCGERIRLTIGSTFRIYDHPEHGNHTVCDWRPGMEPTGRVATPIGSLEPLTKAIADRTDGRRLGEMTGDEIAAAFASGPIHFRNGEVVAEP